MADISQDLSDEQKYIIAVLGIVGGLLSFLGSCSIIAMFCYQRYYYSKNLFYQKLVVYLSLSDIIWITNSTLNEIDGVGTPEFITNNAVVCGGSAFLMQWFMVASDFWICAMSIYMYMKVVRRIDLEDYEWTLHLIVWGVSFLIATAPFFGAGGGYGYNGLWCWIRDIKTGMFFTYSPAWASFVVIIVTYTYIFRYMRLVKRAVGVMGAMSVQKDRLYKGVFRKLSLYPFVFFASWIPASVNRIQNILQPNYPIFILFLLHTLFLNLSGVLNFLLYGKAVHKKLFPTKSENDHINNDAPKEKKYIRIACKRLYNTFTR